MIVYSGSMSLNWNCDGCWQSFVRLVQFQKSFTTVEGFEFLHSKCFACFSKFTPNQHFAALFLKNSISSIKYD